MAKLIEFNIEARRGLEAGMNTLADAVKVTPVSYTHLTLPTILLV